MATITIKPKRKVNSLKPLADRIVVKARPDIDKLGSIHLPEQSIKKNQVGDVIAVGSKCKFLSPQDTIVFGIGCGLPVEFRGDELLFMRESDALTKL